MTRWAWLWGALWLAGCASDEYVRLYHTEDKAESLDWGAIEGLDHLGATRVDKGVNFGVYSAHAERIELLLFDDPERDQPTQQFEMARFGDVWNLYVEGVGDGQHYGFIAWGPNWTYEEDYYPGSLIGFKADVDENGHRFNPNKLLFDPYGRILHRDHDWARSSPASGPYREQQTYGSGSKSVVVASDYAWSDHEDTWQALRSSGDHPGHGPNDLIVYEVHAKGLTANASSRQFGVEHPGTYRGVGEMAGYLQDLGITAVELLPVHEKPLADGGYWGYNSLSFFAPEVSYSSAHLSGLEPREILDEFKWMVDQLHQHDIEVILDVVYNHTGEGGLWRTKLFFNDADGDYICDPGNAVNLDSQEVASLQSWRGLDNVSYYVLSDTNQAYWLGSTGVHNQTRANHTPMRRMIQDSIRYWVDEMHVDGFRFDLAGVLGEADGAPSQYWTTEQARSTVLQDLIDDPDYQARGVRFIAEPWTTAYDASAQYPMSSGDPAFGWSEWNAHFRDWWRVFLNEDEHPLNAPAYDGGFDGGAVMTATYDRYAWNGKQPFHTVNFITAHDGFTLFDLMSYEEKENACGPLNPVCCYDACSQWCDPTSGDWENRSRNWGDEPLKRQMMRNAFVGMAISHGSVMLLGGDEWMRTQYGNNNAYSTEADNDWNWFRWGEWTSQNANNIYRHRMHDFVRTLLQFRRARPYAFSPETWGEGLEIFWLGADGQPADESTWVGRHLQLHYADTRGVAEPELVVLINMEDAPVTFQLPTGAAWARVVDTQAYFDLPGQSGEPTGWFDDQLDVDPFLTANASVTAPVSLPEGNYQVAARSIVILEQED